MGRVALHGENHESSLLARADVASVLAARGQTEAAERKLREVVAKLSRSVGQHADSSLAVKAALADLLAQSSATREEAVELYTAVLAQQGPAASVGVKANLAVCYDQLDQSGEAEALTDEVYAEHLRLLGPDAAETQLSQANLWYFRARNLEQHYAVVDTLTDPGCRQRVVALYSNSGRTWAKHLGEEHEAVAKAKAAVERLGTEGGGQGGEEKGGKGQGTQGGGGAEAADQSDGVLVEAPSLDPVEEDGVLVDAPGEWVEIITSMDPADTSKSKTTHSVDLNQNPNLMETALVFTGELNEPVVVSYLVTLLECIATLSECSRPFPDIELTPHTRLAGSRGPRGVGVVGRVGPPADRVWQPQVSSSA